MSTIKDQHPEEDRFHGSYEAIGAQYERVNVADLEVWITDIEAGWDSLEGCSAYFGGWGEGVGFDLNLKDNEVRLNSEGETLEAVNAVITEFANLWELPSPADSDSLKQRASGTYFARHALTRDWLIDTTAKVVKLAERCDRFTGSVNTHEYFGESIDFHDKDEWLKHATSHWEATAICQMRLVGHWDYYRLRFQLARGLVEIEVESDKRMEEVLSGLRLFEELLDLDPVGPDPYKYRKSSALYKIKNWRRKSFADALGILHENMSDGHPPVVEEAYVKEGFENMIEKLAGFDEFPPFLDYLCDPNSEIGEVGIRLAGQRGKGIGIYVSSDHSRLQVRTTEPPKNLSEIVHPFAEPLKLKLTDDASTGVRMDADAPAPQEHWWVKHIVAIIVAIIGALAVFVQIGEAWRTDYLVKLVLPGESGAVIKANAGDIAIAWYLKPHKRLIWGDLHDEPATVSAYLGSQLHKEWRGLMPGQSIQLQPGTYKLVVDVTSVDAEPASLNVVIH